MRELKFDNLFRRNKAIWVIFLILILVTFSTNFFGSTDIPDYADVAKFFAGKYSADIRSSHSYLYGFIHSPFVGLTNSLIIFKITSLIFLGLIIYSIYLINNRSRKTLWLALLSPVIWYMAPWINPIQLASLFLLWSWYFIRNYNKDLKIKNLFYSGLLLGLGWAIWDTILFFGIALGISFLYNRKASHMIFFVLFVFIGLMPRLILDQFIFNFPFYTILKSSFGTLLNVFGGIYNKVGQEPKNIISLLSIFLAIPIYFWLLYRKEFFRQHKKSMIFLSFSIILIAMNPQIRYILALAPIMIVLLSRHLNEKQFKTQINVSIIISLLFIAPYLIQTNYHIGSINDGADFTMSVREIRDLSFSKEFPYEIIEKDIEQIAQEFPNEVFVVGNTPDAYNGLARTYWGDQVKEFVSIQDYNSWLNGKDTLFRKRFAPISNIRSRRQIWLEGGINTNPLDKTDYKSINYAISFENNLDLEGFEKIENYNILTLWGKQ